MIRDSDLTVTDIAHQLEYNDMSHFTRAFRRIAGVTPSEYRRQQTSGFRENLMRQVKQD